MTQLTCTDRAGRHDLTLDLSAFLADDQTDEHAVKLAGEAAERGPGTFEHAATHPSARTATPRSAGKT